MSVGARFGEEVWCEAAANMEMQVGSHRVFEHVSIWKVVVIDMI